MAAGGRDARRRHVPRGDLDGADDAAEKPGQRYLRCGGSLGWAFPATLGAKAALPDKPVVGFCGDAGFYYHMAELETAARAKLNVVMVVNTNYSGGVLENARFEQGGQLREGRRVDGLRRLPRREAGGHQARRSTRRSPPGKPAVVEVVSDAHDPREARLGAAGGQRRVRMEPQINADERG